MSKRNNTTRRGFLKALGGAALALPFYQMLRSPRAAHANNVAKRVIFFYFPDGVGMPMSTSTCRSSPRSPAAIRSSSRRNTGW